MGYLTQTCEEGLWRLLLRQMTVNWLPFDCCQKRSVCHPVLSVCVFQPAMGARCRNEGTWLIKWSKGCWKGLDTASTRGLDTHVFVFWDRERERGQAWRKQEAHICSTPPGWQGSVMGQRPVWRRKRFYRRSLVLILTAFPDLPLQSFSFLFYVSPTLNPNTLSYCYTHKYTRTFQVKGMGAWQSGNNGC